MVIILSKLSKNEVKKDNRKRREGRTMIRGIGRKITATFESNMVFFVGSYELTGLEDYFKTILQTHKT